MYRLKRKHIGIISLFLAKKIIISLVVIIAFEALAFSAPALAAEESVPAETDNCGVSANLAVDENPYLDIKVNYNDGKLPTISSNKTRAGGYHPMTAYNSEAAQTDNSPCITANGFNVCKHGVEDTVAANFLPFGTKVKIPEVFGDRVFVVRDRMNSRYTDRIDVWMLKRQDALKFGVKLAKIEILEP